MGVSVINFLEAYLLPFNILNVCLEILDLLILLITHTHTKESSINTEGSLIPVSTLEWYDHLHLPSAEILGIAFSTGVWLQLAANIPREASACALSRSQPM